MAWTVPRTWVTSEVVTAALLNTHIRDNEVFLRAHHGCVAYKSADQNVAAGNTDVVTWDSEVYDTDAIHDTATNNSRFVAPTGFDGYWRFDFFADVDADTANHNGRFACQLRKNAAGSASGGTFLNGKSFAGHAFLQAGFVVAVANLIAGDYVEAFFNSVTEARLVQSGLTGSLLFATYLGN